MEKNKYKKTILYDHLDQQQQQAYQQSESQQHLYNGDFCTTTTSSTTNNNNNNNNNNINPFHYISLNDNNTIFNSIHQHDNTINNLFTPFHPLSNNNNSYLSYPLFDINHNDIMGNNQINFTPNTITCNTNSAITANNNVAITDNSNNNIQPFEAFQQHYNIINSLFIPTSPLSTSHSPPPSLNVINNNENTNDLQLTIMDNNNNNGSINNNSKSNNNNSNNGNSNRKNNKYIKKKAKNKKWDQIKKMIDYFTQSMLPIKINDTIDSTCFLDLIMEKARKHWCCIGFKVAPITIDLIRNWRNAPETIIYCIASIALVTIMDHQATEGYVKNAAMAFYEQATQKIDNFIFDDDDDDDENYYYSNKKKIYDNDNDYNYEEKRQKKKAMTIQSYFCLSYTSNLLRLYEQQRTWGGLASVALQLKTNDAKNGCRPMNQAIILCWCRWYYIDAWLSLTLQRECLLPDQPPAYILNAIQQAQHDSTLNYEHQSLFQFTVLTRFMRKYIQAIQSKQLLDPTTLRPTFTYYKITDELKKWYDHLSLPDLFSSPPSTTTKDDNQHQLRLQVHLHLCYHAMRLVVLYQFLSQDKPPQDDHLLMDGLETNLNLLQSLQQLASQGCDQSTYHHMFFAIHNTAARIYQYKTTWQKWAEEQLQMNLILLKSTQAYVNDVFQMRIYAEKIEQQFEKMGLKISNYYKNTLHSIQQLQELKQVEQKERLLEKILIHLSRRRRKRKKKGEISNHLSQEEEVALLLNQYLKRQYQTVISSSSISSSSLSASPALLSPVTTTNSSPTTSTIPGVHVYKLSVNSTIRRPGLQKNNKLRCEKKMKKNNKQ